MLTTPEKQLDSTILFVGCLSVNTEKRENIEVHLNEFGYCSRCAGISPWAEMSAKTLFICNEKKLRVPHAWTAIFDQDFSVAWLTVSLFRSTCVIFIGVLCTQAFRASHASPYQVCIGICHVLLYFYEHPTFILALQITLLYSISFGKNSVR